MKVLRFTLLLGICLLSLLLFSCKGSEGPAGADGPPGSANVQYSAWFSPGTWSGSTFDWFFDTTATGITQSIIDSGVVLAYMKLANDSMLVRPLPAYPTYTSVYVYNYAIPSVGKIRFTVVTNDGLYIPSTLDKFRYVIIPGGMKLAKQSGVNYSSYQSVKEHYHIPG